MAVFLQFIEKHLDKTDSGHIVQAVLSVPQLEAADLSSLQLAQKVDYVHQCLQAEQATKHLNMVRFVFFFFFFFLK